MIVDECFFDEQIALEKLKSDRDSECTALERLEQELVEISKALGAARGTIASLHCECDNYEQEIAKMRAINHQSMESIETLKRTRDSLRKKLGEAKAQWSDEKRERNTLLDENLKKLESLLDLSHLSAAQHIDRLNELKDELISKMLQGNWINADRESHCRELFRENRFRDFSSIQKILEWLNTGEIHLKHVHSKNNDDNNDVKIREFDLISLDKTSNNEANDYLKKHYTNLDEAESEDLIDERSNIYDNNKKSETIHKELSTPEDKPFKRPDDKFRLISCAKKNNEDDSDHIKDSIENNRDGKESYEANTESNEEEKNKEEFVCKAGIEGVVLQRCNDFELNLFEDYTNYFDQSNNNNMNNALGNTSQEFDSFNLSFESNPQSEQRNNCEDVMMTDSLKNATAYEIPDTAKDNRSFLDTFNLF